MKNADVSAKEKYNMDVTKSGMHVVDSCGWINYFENGRFADDFESILLDIEHLIVPTIIFYEVFKYFMREHGNDSAFEVGFAMKEAELVPVSHVIAFQAADLSLEHRLGMGDALILASARAYYAKFYTLDADFDGLDGVVNFLALAS